ncbi:phage holin family protein [Amycolatopsis sp. K13G38]|uniref:Phage holin family protein n=1 Tax=Amycolatopsis acididurans TaxID=2724524 RepID=A0ABX1JEL6_9PSEU|nr:phage holin family protein [Amycolatopsis acididurans]NKQ57155.1 phage holin family protein [Amycolatopsis acididurans]
MSEEVRGSTAVEGRSVAQLVQDASEQMRRLVRDELRLATSELKEKGKHAGVGAGLAGAAGIVAVFGGATLIAAAVLALALVVPAWLSALLIGAALLVIGGIAAMVGGKQLKSATPPVPEEAAAGVKKDVSAMRGDYGHG